MLDFAGRISCGRVDVGVYRRAEATLGEGPCWDPALGELIWVDILRRQVHVGDRAYETPEYVGAAVPRAGGGLLLATGAGFATLDLDGGAVEVVARVPVDPAAIRMNDGKTDPAGRFWAGTMALDETPGSGALFRLDGPGDAPQIVAPVTISNGLGWSLDGERMFYVDTPTKTIARYPFDMPTGALGERSLLADTSRYSGSPDGLAMDADGNLWVAFWDGAAVRCFSGADGSLLEEIVVPVSRPTSCTFGGPDLRQLMITSARDRLSDDDLARQPLAGSVLVAEPGVAGLPPTPAIFP